MTKSPRAADAVMTLRDDAPAGTASTARVFRYHPLLVALHWLLAFLVIAALCLGALRMARIPNTSPMKIEALRAHMIGGGLILVLMLTRLYVRVRTAHPLKADAGLPLLNRIARISHRALYALVLVQAGSGLFMALETHLLQVIFLHHGSLPADFWAFPIRRVHYAISRALMAVITLHITGALYHIVIRQDGLLIRMWFGRRKMPTAPELGGPRILETRVTEERSRSR